MNYKVLINRKHPYQENKQLQDYLINYTNIEGENFLIERKTYQAFLQLQQNVKALGYEIDICSAYRSIDEQKILRDEYLIKYGSKYAEHFVAMPGVSEHHSGLCIDIGIIYENKFICDNLQLMMPKYLDIFEKIIIPELTSCGFILRYPKDKESITGYQYEPWHYRYVGKHTAKLMYEQNITLEEYCEKYQKSGILLIDKPKDMTSRDVVNVISKTFDTTKVGHNGTLDPIATGLLVITINKATKINEYLTAEDKEYYATVQIGQKTDTGDITGTILETSDKVPTKKEIMQVIANFPKCYEQEVPIYSAIKIKGKKLYEYARKKEEITLPTRIVQIKEFELISYQSTEFVIRTLVSKGCYIRSLIQDIAKLLAVPLTMKELRRTKQGSFLLDKATKLADITVDMPLLSITEVLPAKKGEISKEIEKKVYNGAVIDNKYGITEDILFIKNDEAVALYYPEGNILKIKKMLK